VEGHEASVLRGARTVIENNSPYLFLELHNEMISSEGGDPGAALDILEAHAYRVRDLNGDPITRNGILRLPILRVTAEREAPKAN
jgi:hypothetical protein